MDLHRTETIVGIIAGVIVIMGATYKWGTFILSWLKKKLFLSNNPLLPKETIKLVVKHHGTWWHMGASDGKPAMQVVSHLYVTNITKGDILITRGLLKKPKTEGIVMVRHPRKDIYGSYAIFSGETSNLVADFWVQPPVNQKGETFVGDIVIIDQLGNEHLVERVEFLYK